MKKLTIFLAFLLFVGFSVQAQMQISGTVTSAEDGLSIPGVSVVVKDNPTIGTTTDIDGKYSLTVPSSAQTLLFSFVGMKASEVIIGGRSVINLVMESEVLEMDEVVVVAYGTQKKSSFTGSASVVKTDVIDRKPVTSFEKSLQGTVTGVQISSSSGQPGASTSIRIRGTGSINAGNDPLYIVDGIPVITGDLAQRQSTTNALSTINPSDIESITVLKDASATSLYGSRASNGVILITTKSGKSEDTKFDFSFQSGFSSKTTDKFKVLNADQYREYRYESYVNAGRSTAEAQALVDALGNYDTDWLDEAFRNGKTNDYKLSAKGGNEKTTFFVSGNYFQQEGLVIGTDLERMSARINIDHKANKKLSFGTKITGSYTDQNNSSGGGYYSDPITSAYFIPPTEPVYNEDGTYNQTIPANLDYNLVAVTDLDKHNNNMIRGLGSVYFQYDIIEGLSWKTNAGVDYYYLGENEYWNPNSPSGESYDGYSEYASSASTMTTITNTLRFDKTFKDVHSLGILLGQEAQQSSNFQTFTSNSKFPSDQVITLANGAEPLTASTSETAWSLASYFSNLNYNFDNRYYLSASFRRDGSSRFGADNKWANFWSVGGSWRITEEEFMNVAWIDNLKLRASYGTSGNSDIGNFAARGLYSYGNDYNGFPGSAPSQIENPELKWEKNVNYDIGLDISVLESRVNFTVEYYNRTTSDLLLNVPISSVTGPVDNSNDQTILQNIGEMSNSGFEFELNTVNLNGDFKWFTDFNISFNKNEVTKLNNNEDIIENPYIHSEGDPYYTFYLPKWAGVNPSDGMPLWYDEDGNIVNTYANADYQKVGSAHPDYFGGFTNRFSYKGLELNVFFNYMYGNDIWNNSKRYLLHDGQQGAANASAEILDRWQEPGDITDVPKIIDGNSTGSSRASSRFIEDGSYLRLKNVVLAYNLPSKYTEKIKIRSIRIFAQGENLYTWTNFTGLDPETGVDGQSWFQYPSARTITFGIDIGL